MSKILKEIIKEEESYLIVVEDEPGETLETLGAVIRIAEIALRDEAEDSGVAVNLGDIVAATYLGKEYFRFLGGKL